MQEGDLEPVLRDNSLGKMLSNLYKCLFVDVNRVLTPCGAAWEEVLPQLDGDNWDDLWEIHFSRLVSARDHLIQYIAYTLLRPDWLGYSPPSCPAVGGVPHPVQILCMFFGTVWPYRSFGWR